MFMNITDHRAEAVLNALLSGGRLVVGDTAYVMPEPGVIATECETDSGEKRVITVDMTLRQFFNVCTSANDAEILQCVFFSVPDYTFEP